MVGLLLALTTVFTLMRRWFCFFSAMFYSIGKEGTTRWLKGLEGFPEIPRQGAGCWSPEGWASKPSFFWPWRSHSGNTRQDSALPCLEQPSSSKIPVAPHTDTPPQTKQPPRCRALKEAKGQILPRKRACPVLTEPHFCAMCQQSTEGKDDPSLAR